jgi:SAM-dependent methyltransferase
MAKEARYIPALGLNWLTPLYDPLLRWVLREEEFKRHLIRNAHISPGQRVLDLGCGTATLTIMLKQAHPQATVIGLDGDPKILEIGRKKTQQAGVEVVLDKGMAYQLPYPNQYFDRVLSSLVLHHLTTDNKRRALQDVVRVLLPGGEFHVVDFGKPHTTWGRLIAPVIWRLEQASDNISGRLPEMFRQAGLEQVNESAQFGTLFGTLSIYQGRKPE